MMLLEKVETELKDKIHNMKSQYYTVKREKMEK
jgi:hypothetical protein